jgi:hypothetical protein
VPVAAAMAVALVVGLAVALSSLLPGSGPGSRSPGLSGQGTGTVPPRYYVEAELNGSTVVRSTATGAVTATVPNSRPFGHAIGYGTATVAASGHGTFFVAGFMRGAGGERIYRFRLTGSGQISVFSPVPGGVLGVGQLADAMAVSPNGSQIAVGISFPDGKSGKLRTPSDEIVVIKAATGVQSVWRGGLSRLGSSFNVGSLSWTGDGRELVVLGQWCGQGAADSEVCGGSRVAEVWAVNSASGGGQLDSGHLLLRQSARFPYIAQALISPDGSTITALVLTGSVIGSHSVSGAVPDDLSVEQISVATGRQLRVLYHRHMGPSSQLIGAPDFLSLSADGAGQHWLLDGGISGGSGYDNGFNGWIDGGRLVPLQTRDGYVADEAW